MTKAQRRADAANLIRAIAAIQDLAIPKAEAYVRAADDDDFNALKLVIPSQDGAHVLGWKWVDACELRNG
jgi:hypothetical protein